MPRFSALKLSVMSVVLLTYAAHASPPQYYAQLYTEILGRSPEPSEWVANEYQFTENSIGVTNVRNVIVSFLQSSEFRNLGYTSSEKAYLLYRAIFLREPGTAEMASISDRIASGVSAASVAGDMMNSTEFSNLLNEKIRHAKAHGYRITGPSPRPSIGTQGLGNINGAELQARLDEAAASGSTIYLSRGALVRLYSQLVVPSGVTLTTYDANATDHVFRNRKAYAAMGRLVRQQLFNEPLIKVQPGGKLIGVWVDGRRSQLRQNDPTLKAPTLSAAERNLVSENILLLGGPSGDLISEVAHCKLSDSSGWTTLHGVGSDGGHAIGVSRIENNMITSYTASRDLEEAFFTDGISNASSNAVIINNDIVDPSDVGVVLFNSGLAVQQCSQVMDNSILFAGVNGWGGITLDHSVGIWDLCAGVNPEAPYNCFDAGNEAITSNFENTVVQNNQIWSSDNHHANVGISLGVQLWGLRMFGIGGQVLANQLGTPTQPFNTGVGIVVSGIKQPIVLENTLNLHLDQSLVSCHSTALLLDPTKTALDPGIANIQGGFVTGETWGMLRPKSNGYIFGNYDLIPASQSSRVVAVETVSSTLVIQDSSATSPTDDWVILQSERNFGDDDQLYYIIKNRGTAQVAEAIDSTIRIAPFSGSDTQYWRLEAFNGVTPGTGMRLVNRVTGQYFGRDANGVVFASTDTFNSSVNWKFRKIETRELDLDQSELLFMDPFGEIFQIYTDATHIYEDRSVGNPNADFGLQLFADDNSLCRPLGLFDLNGDHRPDAAFLLEDGRLFVCYQGSSGFSNGIDLGNMRDKWTWDISKNFRSWEKPVGFINVGGSAIEDLVVIDWNGDLEVGYINPDGLAETVELGSAADIGLAGASSLIDAAIKPVGSGDFDGDGVRELLFVGPAGGLFRVKASNGSLHGAVSIGNPVESFGWGFTSASDSYFKPVAITDVNDDGIDDVVMVEGSGYLYAYIMRNGVPVGGTNLGSPQKSWNWNLNTYSRYSRPLGISYGKGWWGW